jgi:hypothetical protein
MIPQALSGESAVSTNIHRIERMGRSQIDGGYNLLVVSILDFCCYFSTHSSRNRHDKMKTKQLVRTSPERA